MNKFKVGDVVRYVQALDRFNKVLTTGKEYTVKSLEYDGVFGDKISITCDDGTIRSYMVERFELVSPSDTETNDTNGSQSEEIRDTKRYGMEDGRQLFEHYEEMFTADEVRGFYKLNIIKYITRYSEKNGIADLEKADVYLDQLAEFEKGKLDERKGN